MKLFLHEPKVVARGPVCEEAAWGYFQFPRVHKLPDGRLAVWIHDEDDQPHTLGLGAKLWYVSEDEGETWQKGDSSLAGLCGTEVSPGVRMLPIAKPVLDLTALGLEIPPFRLAAYNVPSDRVEQPEKSADPHKMPEGIGGFYDAFTSQDRYYYADTLPEGLTEKTLRFLRYDERTGETSICDRPVEWPYLPVKTYRQPDAPVRMLQPGLHESDNLKRGPGGTLWVSTYSTASDPENGALSTYDAAYLLRSDDGGDSWKLAAWQPYIPDTKADKLAWWRDGFSETDFEFMPDGSMIMLLRSTCVFHGGPEWGPLYFSRSADGGKTWTKPQVFDKIGILPQLRRLECGVTLAIYGRPGIFVRASEDPSGLRWEAPVEVMTPKDRSGLMNRPPVRPNFHQWAGSCCNVHAAILGPNKIIIAYSDFYVPDEKGIKRKTILTQVIEVR